MSEKPKRKNDEPIPRRYWWIFGTLAILLLITLWFPIRILYWWELNPLLYGLVILACLLATVRFIRRFHWKRGIVIVMLGCNLLAGLHLFHSTKIIPFTPEQCRSTDNRLYMMIGCAEETWGSAAYISVSKLPIAIEIDSQVFTFCCLF